MPPLHGGGDRNVRTEENSMKRSEINAALKEMEGMIRDYRIALPPFCYFTPEEWQQKGHEFDEVRDNMLGWDITDYGLGRFDEVGFSLITLRNGNLKKKDRYPKPYAEKLLYLKEGQYSPMHFHWYKMEDIINRGGGTVLIRVYNADEKDSITQKLYHDFEVVPGTGPVLLGEVSQCNDDNSDNRFNPPVGRFPAIEEDEAPYRLLCSEYPEAKE